jgi:hypothetical protein
MPALQLSFAICAFAYASAATQSLSNWQLQPLSGYAVSDTVANALRSAQSGGWFNVTVPCTIIACLLQNNVRAPPADKDVSGLT